MHHYVYKVTHSITNQYYIGSRTCKKKPEEDIGYLGSQVTWKLTREEKERCLEKEILMKFDNRKDTILFEALLIRESIMDPLNENYHIPSEKFTGLDINIDKITVKDKSGSYYQIHRMDPRYLSGELVSVNLNMTVVKDERGNYIQVNVNDPRYLSGELLPSCIGRITLKDKANNHFMVDLDDPRYLSGELVHMRTGISPVNKGDIEILQIKDGVIIKRWKNLVELHETMGYPKSTILGWINHKKKAKNGYVWKYNKKCN